MGIYLVLNEMSRVIRKLAFCIWAVESQMMAIVLCSENKGADKLFGQGADLRHCFQICKRLIFS